MRCPACGHSTTTRVPLTKRQAELYQFLRIHIERAGYAPSYQEIADQFEYRSLSTVSEHLETLERKGWITRSQREARGIALVPDAPVTGEAILPRPLHSSDCCVDPRHDAPCYPICAKCEAECDPRFRERTTDVTPRRAVCS